MTVIIYLICLVILTYGIIHEHDVVVFKILADELVVETLGSIGLTAHELTLGIIAGPFELCGRHAKTLDQNTVNLGKHLHLALRGIGRLEFTQFKTELAQFLGQDGTHLGSVVALICLRHHILRYHSVLHDQV